MVPMPRPKRLHMADKVDQHGNVSALCFGAPRPIALRRASWTIRPDAVTCPACKQRMAAGLDASGADAGGGA